MRQAAKPFVFIMMMLGITSGIGAMINGNKPWFSFQLASFCFLVLILISLKEGPNE
jgi:hypothetical protein